MPLPVIFLSRAIEYFNSAGYPVRDDGGGAHNPDTYSELGRDYIISLSTIPQRDAYGRIINENMVHIMATHRMPGYDILRKSVPIPQVAVDSGSTLILRNACEEFIREIESMPRNNTNRRWQQQVRQQQEQQRTEAARARTQQAAERGVARAQAWLERDNAQQQATNSTQVERLTWPEVLSNDMRPGFFIPAWERSQQAGERPYQWTIGVDPVERQHVIQPPTVTGTFTEHDYAITVGAAGMAELNRAIREDFERELLFGEAQPITIDTNSIAFHDLYHKYWKVEGKKPAVPAEPEWQPTPLIEPTPQERDAWGF